MESSPPTDGPAELESQGRHAFAAVRNLIDRIEKTCSEADAEDLIKRFFNSAKTNDFRKFKRGIRKLTEKDDRSADQADPSSADEHGEV